MRKPQGTNSEGKESGAQVNDLEHKEDINIQPQQNEETGIKKQKQKQKQKTGRV